VWVGRSRSVSRGESRPFFYGRSFIGWIPAAEATLDEIGRFHKELFFFNSYFINRRAIVFEIIFVPL
jgi:hypothetical protein